MSCLTPLAFLLTLTPLFGDKLPDPIRLGRAAGKSEVPALHRPSIAFSPDGQKLAWMHYLPDRDLKEGGLLVHMWDVDKRLPLGEMTAGLDRTFATAPLRFTPNGRMLVAASARVLSLFEDLGKPEEKIRPTVTVWLVFSGRELFALKGDIGTTAVAWEAIAVSADGKTLTALAGKGGRTWKLPECKDEKEFALEAASHWVLSADGTLAAGTAADKTVRVWNTADGKAVQKLPATATRALVFAPDNKRLAAVQDGKLGTWEIETGKQVLALDAAFGKAEPHCDWSPDGKQFAWNESGKIKIINVADGKLLRTLAGESGPIAFSPTGSRFAVACPDGTALVWELLAKK